MGQPVMGSLLKESGRASPFINGMLGSIRDRLWGAKDSARLPMASLGGSTHG
ncbi:uncharacterized protein G2W53_016435 [Senna tora]|uniref:Uncharacterized protein n=1 Tax=Senna tora TaxID=362788 RepID=A0A834TQU4_9FABA|nr:uncharacterized protein G2W53_016435 [Senna tora]